MFSPWNRRDFIKNSARMGLIAGVGDFAFLNSLPPVAADEAAPVRNLVALNSDIEPLVRLIEDTPRNRLLERVAERIRTGTSYQDLLSAVMLAGVRGIQPRPVGFKFHAVLVINSAHLAAQAAGDRDRWLPLFWALDNFKNSQADNARQGNWHMAPVNEAQLPSATQARRRFIEAMDSWNEEGADIAVAALARTAGAGDIFELFLRYGARDFRDIGHKAIYVANSWRTLQAMGLRHAEPILRSLAYALLEHRDAGNPAQRDDPADRPWRDNVRRVTRIREGWQRGRIAREATTELLDALRSAGPDDASERVVALLNRGIDPASLWDALFLTAGELLMRQGAAGQNVIVGIHCVTSINALHFGYQASANDETRRLLLLQGAAFLTMFRQAMRLTDNTHVDTLEKIPVSARGPAAIEEILAFANGAGSARDRMTAARKTLALLEADRSQAPGLLAAARRLIFTKGTNSHDYKFASAILEDYFHATAGWRDRFLATGMFNLRGTAGPDTGLLNRTRAALTTI
jgi:hypothetical protein